MSQNHLFSNFSSFFAIGRRVTYGLTVFRPDSRFSREERSLYHEFATDASIHGVDMSEFEERVFRPLLDLTWSDGTPCLTPEQRRSVRLHLSYEYSVELLSLVAEIARGNLS